MIRQKSTAANTGSASSGGARINRRVLRLLRLLRLLLVSILISLSGALIFLAWQWAVRQTAGIRSPAEVAAPGPFIENGRVGIWPDHVYHGIVDLFYYDLGCHSEGNGEWRQFNNFVPVASTRLFTNNAEMEHARIDVKDIQSNGEVVQALLGVERFSNGIELDMLVTLEGNSIKVEVFPVENSARINRLTLGTYAGFMTWPTEVYYGGGALLAGAFDPPLDGHLIPGGWIRMPGRDIGEIIEIRAEGYVVQTMQVLPGPGIGDWLEVELRATPWLATQPFAERPWFEAVQLVRPFAIDRNTWIFSVVTPW